MTTSTQRIVRTTALITISLFWLGVNGQEGDTDDASDPTVERLEQQKKEQELRADIKAAEQRAAEAEAATIEARAGETEALEGEVSLNDGAGYFSEVLAYGALQQVASEIAEDVVARLKNDTRKIIVVQNADLSTDIALWELTMAQVDRLSARQVSFLENYADDEPGAAELTIPGATALVSSVADLVGYFRSDTELTKYDVTLNESALLAQVVAAINQKDPSRTVVFPGRGIDMSGPLFQGLANLAEQRNKLLERNKAIQAKDSESDYAKAAKSEIQSLTSTVATFIEELTKPPEDGVPAPLQTLSYIDKLKAYPDDVFLSVSIAGQGGEVEITKSIWTGGRISYIGGATSVYYLSSASGELIGAGTFSSYKKAAYGTRRGVESLEVDELE